MHAPGLPAGVARATASSGRGSSWSVPQLGAAYLTPHRDHVAAAIPVSRDHVCRLAESEVDGEARERGAAEMGERRARAGLFHSPRDESGILVVDLHLAHLDAHALSEEVAQIARQAHRDRRIRHAYDAARANHELEPPLGLEQVLWHGRWEK